MTRVMIEASGLHKRFGATHALRGLDLSAKEGTVLGVLGPNGAGKTTAVRILTTLTRPNAGTATVAGIDVLSRPAEVRGKIGVAGQYAALDELLTGRENLAMVGRLHRLPGAEARRRADELIGRFEVAEADRPVKTYSGGMRRRLDLGAALISQPPVIFLDEPTTGLDPKGRLSMWDLIEQLAAGGTTVLMTTQYLEEADRLADDIVVIDHGRAIARGTSLELKRQVGGERLEVTVREGQDPSAAGSILEALGEGRVHVDAERRRASVPVASHDGVLTRAIRELDAAGVEVDDAGFRRPTLDEVFLALTGRTPEEADAAAEELGS
ncbi:MAG TPA: ATP-binding cassette domain-containing protein [Candidatus Limnocylindria bacterium]|jgi:ABC-2 type transport system ATP-binding protein|nr:ATP-binding cassette domain-containing protein [Candidatus Limnocylindria bacterium]